MPASERVVEEGEILARHTTIGLGGPARYMAVCHTTEELLYWLEWSKQRGIGVKVLGGGSNLIFPDAGFDGLVLRIGLLGVAYDDGPGTTVVTAAAGEPWDELVADCVMRGLAGIECLSGIPGLVGATPIQNVGAYGQEVAETISTVKAIDRHTLRPVEFRNAECRFEYRQSRFRNADRDRYLITEVVFRLAHNGALKLEYEELRKRVEEQNAPDQLPPGAEGLKVVRSAVLELRRAKSMLIDASDPNGKSVGSFFMNSHLDDEEYALLEERWHAGGGRGSVRAFRVDHGFKVPAAWLVEQAGFRKGYNRCGAAISTKHALALINKGGTTSDLLRLAEEIRTGVEERFGIRLQTEPVVVC